MPNQPGIHTNKDAPKEESIEKINVNPDGDNFNNIHGTLQNNYGLLRSYRKQLGAQYRLSRPNVPKQSTNYGRIRKGKVNPSENGKNESIRNLYKDSDSFKRLEEPRNLENRTIIDFLPSESSMSSFESKKLSKDKHYEEVNNLSTRNKTPFTMPTDVMKEILKIDKDSNLRYLHEILPKHPFDTETNRLLHRSYIPNIHKLNAADMSINNGKPDIKNKPLVRSRKPLLYGSDVDGISFSDVHGKLPDDYSESRLSAQSINSENGSRKTSPHVNTNVDELVNTYLKRNEMGRNIFIDTDDRNRTDLSNHGESISHSKPRMTLKISGLHSATNNMKKTSENGNGEDLIYLNRVTETSHGARIDESIPVNPSVLVEKLQDTIYKNYVTNSDHTFRDFSRIPLGIKKPVLLPINTIMSVEHSAVFDNKVADLSYLSGYLPKSSLGSIKLDALPTNSFIPVMNPHGTIYNSNGISRHLSYPNGNSKRAPLEARKLDFIPTNPNMSFSPIMPMGGHRTIYSGRVANLSYLNGTSFRAPDGSGNPDAVPTKALPRELTIDNSQNNGDTYGNRTALKTKPFNFDATKQLKSYVPPHTANHGTTNINTTRETLFHLDNPVTRPTVNGSKSIGLIIPVGCKGSTVGIVDSPKTSGIGIFIQILKDFGTSLRILPKELSSPTKPRDC